MSDMLEQSTLQDYYNTYNPEWASVMPANCPPEVVCVPVGHTFFRYSRNQYGYSPEDFRTYAELNPGKDWGEMLPLAVGLSVMDNERKARMNMKLPYLRKFKGIISLTLNQTDGVVKQTGVHTYHYTWWRTKSFDTSNLKMLTL